MPPEESERERARVSKRSPSHFRFCILLIQVRSLYVSGWAICVYLGIKKDYMQSPSNGGSSLMIDDWMILQQVLHIYGGVIAYVKVRKGMCICAGGSKSMRVYTGYCGVVWRNKV